MLFGWIGFGRCVRSAQHDVSDNVGIHFGTMLGTEEEVPEAEDEEKLARDHDCDFSAELRLARGDVVGFHCWEIRRMHINRFMLRPSEPKKPQELSNKTCKLTKTT